MKASSRALRLTMARPSHGSRLQPIVAVGLDRVQVELLVRGLSLSPSILACTGQQSHVRRFVADSARSLALTAASLIEFIVIVVSSR